jgi:hypothetical protein
LNVSFWGVDDDTVQHYLTLPIANEDDKMRNWCHVLVQSLPQAALSELWSTLVEFVEHYSTPAICITDGEPVIEEFHIDSPIVELEPEPFHFED